MGASPPPQRRLPLWPLRWPRLHHAPRALLGLGLCGLFLWVSMTPQRQTLEAALKVSALSFVLQDPGGNDTVSYQGFLVVSARSLTITGLGDGVVLLSGQSLPLKGGNALSLSVTAADSLVIKFALAPGTRIENLQQEGTDELVLDLLPPRHGATSGAAAQLVITPPSQEASPGRAPAGALQAKFQQPNRAAEEIVPPQADFPLYPKGPIRLRLQRASPMTPMVFESNLHASDVQFMRKQQSLFDQSPITLSTLLAGTLHLGRQQPLNLRSNQFLRLDPPGIGVITSLRTDQGQLAVEVVGETARIRSGLSFQHPSADLQGTLLSRHLSPEQISAFFGFLAGVISSLVLTLFKGE